MNVQLPQSPHRTHRDFGGGRLTRRWGQQAQKASFLRGLLSWLFLARAERKVGMNGRFRFPRPQKNQGVAIVHQRTSRPDSDPFAKGMQPLGSRHDKASFAAHRGQLLDILTGDNQRKLIGDQPAEAMLIPGALLHRFEK